MRTPQQAGKEAQRDTAGAVAVQVPYLRCVGLQEEAEGAHSTPVFTCAHAPAERGTSLHAAATPAPRPE